jgi:hypothetical protein
MAFIILLLSVFTPNATATVNPVFIESKIIIDGNLNDPQWADIPIIDDFTVINPDTGAKPKHPTHTRILYNKEGVYFAINNFQPRDTQVQRMTARDNAAERDNIQLVLDTSGKGTYGYIFNVGLGGSLLDGTVKPERQFAYEWNAPWQAQTRRYDDRWDAEIFIPWSALKLPSSINKRTIGLSVERHISYLAEKWAVPALGKNRSVFLSALLPLQFDVLETPSELTFVPYFSSSMDRLNNSHDQSFGFDVFYQPTSDSQLSLTVSPDFGLVENDDIVVNFSAFETFSPEKRAFFLEGQEIFDPNGAMMVNTRRIGARPDAPELNDDQTIEQSIGFSDIIAAGKYTDQIGDVRLGLISAVEDDSTYQLSDGSHTTIDGRKFLALRALHETINEDNQYQAIGYLGTLTDHYNANAQTHLIDGEYRSADEKWQLNAQLYNSFVNDVQGFGQRFQAKYTPTPGMVHEVRLKHIDDGLNLNDMGFLPRNDINRINYGLRTPEQTKSQHYKAKKQGGWVDLRTNNAGERIETRLGNWHRFNFSDLTQLNITVHYSANAWNDRNTRGNGSYRTNDYLTIWSRWSSDKSQPFSYGVAGWIKQSQIAGFDSNIRPFITYSPADNISIDAQLKYQQRSNWQIWQQEDWINTFNSQLVDFTIKTTWIVDNAQEVRLAMQWVGLRADAQQSYRISNSGDLYESIEQSRAANFSQADLAIQLRYKYQFAPLSDLYLVYSRGGNTYAESLDEQNGFGDLLGDSFEQKNADQLTLKVRYRF